jgi:hypothetical protein
MEGLLGAYDSDEEEERQEENGEGKEDGAGAAESTRFGKAQT